MDLDFLYNVFCQNHLNIDQKKYVTKIEVIEINPIYLI